MPERLLNIGRVGATGQQQGGVGVPKIIPAYPWQLRPLEQWLELEVEDVLGLERVPWSKQTRGPDPAILSKPLAPRVGHQLSPVASEGFYGPLGQIYGAPAGVLGPAEHQSNSIVRLSDTNLCASGM